MITRRRFNTLSTVRSAVTGYLLVGALFLLVVLAGLGVFMVRLSGTEHFVTMLAWQGAGAYYAARSGTEWGSVQALGLGSCPPTPSLLSPAGGLSGGNLDGYRVIVSLDNCTTHREGGNTFRVYTISGSAETANIAYGESGYARRNATVTITDAP